MDTFSCNSYEQNHTPFNYHDDVEIDDHDYDDDQEESGWVTYLDDFSNQYNHLEDQQDNNSGSLVSISPSLVSDAATDAFPNPSFPVNVPEEKKFGKAITKRIYEDDSLEDTASSPVNSPKVSQLEHIRTPPRKIEDYVSSSFVMGNMRSMGDHQIQIQEDDEPKMRMIMKNFIEGTNNNTKDLRSRGLCVVPVSMLANISDRF